MNADRIVYGLVNARDIDAIWPSIKAGVELALQTSDGEATAEDTRAGLKAGRSQLLLMERAGSKVGVVFMLLDFPQFKIARVLLAFGRDMAAVRDLMQHAESWAQAQGCRYIEGWVASAGRLRLFSRFGYHKRYTIIRKPL